MKKILNVLFVVIVLCGGFIGITYACSSNQIDIGNGNCENAKFTITTTNLPANTDFKFKMYAAGVFYIDWGDGNVQTIDRTNNTTGTQYTHTFTAADTYTIKFGGLATGYPSGDSEAITFGNYRGAQTPELIASISGSLGAIFPSLSSYSSNIYQPKFIGTFHSATHITSLPANLFEGVSSESNWRFFYTFFGCTGLTSIPSGLFSGTTGHSAGSFYGVFEYCTGLTSLPPGLFSGISGAAVYMFNFAFYGCSGLSGYIPSDLFSGLILNGSPTVQSMWDSVFDETNLATTCPTGYHQYITGYEDYWDGHVSCEPNTINITWEDATPESVAANNAGSCTYGGTINTPAVAPTKRGYIFTGWSIDTSGN